MKLSAITVLLSAAIVPFAAVSGTVFKCSVQTTFEGKDKTNDPAVPSKPILNWMADDLMQTFIGAYRDNEDFNMASDKFSKFSMKRATTVDQEEGGRSEGYLDALAAKLRGSSDVEGKRWYSWWWYYYRTTGKIVCNYVSVECRRSGWSCLVHSHPNSPFPRLPQSMMTTPVR